MRLLLIGSIGGTNVVSNLGAVVEIKVLDIKNNRVLFEVVTRNSAALTRLKDLKDFEEAERAATKVNSLVSGLDDLAFLKKQAD